MKLKAVRQDQNFILHTKVLYESAVESTKAAYTAALAKEDIDLKEHLEDLNHKELAVNDWDPFPLTDVPPEADFVSDLFTRYLEDIRVRKKIAEWGRPPPAVMLRKTVRLSEIDRIIEEIQERTIGVISTAS